MVSRTLPNPPMMPDTINGVDMKPVYQKIGALANKANEAAQATADEVKLQAEKLPLPKVEMPDTVFGIDLEEAAKKVGEAAKELDKKLDHKPKTLLDKAKDFFHNLQKFITEHPESLLA